MEIFNENKVKDLMNQNQSAIAIDKDCGYKAKAWERTSPTWRYLYAPRRAQESLNAKMQYDNRIVLRQIIECVVVKSKDKIKVIFIDEVETTNKLV